MLALDGMTYVLLAENYCSGVPHSTLNPDGTFTFGSAMTTNQMLDSAIAKFNQSLAVKGSPVTATFTNFAKVGLGRALLDKGDFTDASAAVAGVPATFQYIYQHSSTSARQNNGTWSLTVSVARFGEADREGGNGLPFQSDGAIKVNPTPDWRVADTLNHSGSIPGKGFDGVTPQWVPMKYPVMTSADVIADGVEAQLIQAEATLQSGDAAGALAILNALRANSASARAARLSNGLAGAADAAGHSGSAGGPALQGARVLAVPHVASRWRSPPPHQAVRPRRGDGVPNGPLLQGRYVRAGCQRSSPAG